MSFQIIHSQARTHRPDSQFDGIHLILARMWFGWRVRKGLYEMMGPRIAEDVGSGSTPERLCAAYARRLRRRRRNQAASVMESIVSDMELHSKRLAGALRPVVPDDEYFILEAGESGSNIPAMLDLLLNMRANNAAIFAAYRKLALVMSMYGVMVYGAIYSIAAFALPDMQKTAALSHEQRSAAGQILDEFAAITAGNAPYYVIGIIGALTIAMYLSLTRLTGPARLLLERLPPWSIYRNIQGYVWLTTFVVLMQAGNRPETRIIQEQASMASPWLRERLDALAECMGLHAMHLPRALEQTGFNFPSSEMIDDIDTAWGSGSGGYEKLLRKSDTWAREMVKTATATADVLMTIGTISVWIISGIVMLGSMG
ncbi:pilus biosynthesis protein PilR [Gluconacetobacter diazotrophicus]|uniref:Pilus biosynthesis protein PilR n=1 Tax=Gluconacetobacter diazotrophicus TaxID=33996 RepID=A0A7W4I5K9_GLUDI|nr:pilus biosynthesis protein PilR [Gluconacetobacter diazotrophicus]MBB2156620.1 pilus biosynthesis protein PilR [Gluconacetobacter diazotrophicus]